MLGFMNPESLAETQRTGEAVFFSRSRNKLWKKGESSGHVLRVREMRVDCDADHSSYASKRSGRASVMKVTELLLPKVGADGGAQGHRRAHVRARKGLWTGENSMSRLKLGIPKGAYRTRRSIFFRVQLEDHAGSRSYVPAIDDAEIECLLVRAGDGALRRVRRARRGNHRSRLGSGNWRGRDELSELIYAKQRLARVRWSGCAGRLCDSGTAPLGKKSYRTEVVHIQKLSRQAWRKSPRGVFVARPKSKCRNLRTRLWK